jgi:acyl-coenzyme A thioesterase PaaI-like protein
LEPSSASTSAMATAARFSAGAGSLAGSRANAAQRLAIFRLVASSNSLVMQLDYNTSTLDEMTGNQNSSPRPERPGMTDKAAEKLKASGWTIVETTGFLHLIGPLWQRVVNGEHEYALITQDKHHNRRGLVQGGVLMTFADRSCGMTARYVSGRPTLATVQMDTHFVEAGKIGEILLSKPHVVRSTRSLIFVSTEVTVDKRCIAMASGVFKILKND